MARLRRHFVISETAGRSAFQAQRGVNSLPLPGLAWRRRYPAFEVLAQPSGQGVTPIFQYMPPTRLDSPSNVGGELVDRPDAYFATTGSAGSILGAGLSKDEFVQIRTVSFLPLVLGLLGCPQVNLPMEYLVPENYIGWVSLQCSVAGAPPLQVVDGRLQAPVPTNGRTRTSSECDAGLRSVQYWYVDVSKRRVRELFTERSGEISRVTAIGPELGKSELSGMVFWVGPQPPLEELDASYQALMDTVFRRDSKQP